MSLGIIQGVFNQGNPPAGGVALSGPIGVGQVVLLFAVGGNLPGSATVTDNLSTPTTYSVLASYGGGAHSVIYWGTTVASGTPTVTIATTGGYSYIWCVGVNGFQGIPTKDSSLTATASGNSANPAINATSNFNNEIMLVNAGYNASALNSDFTAYPGWSAGTTGSFSARSAFYAIEATPTADNFSGTITSANWQLLLAGIYDLQPPYEPYMDYQTQPRLAQ